MHYRKWKSDIVYYTYKHNDGQNTKFVNSHNKQILVIGDSQTSMYQWQVYLSHLVNSKVSTHAKGGIGMLQMVDGESVNERIGGSDKYSYASNYLPRLSTDECKDKDIVIVMGLYNTLELFRLNYGNNTDCYPQDSTFCAYFNYMIKRIREELKNSDNMNCRIVLASPHIFGSGPYMKRTAYEYKGLYDSLRVMCKRQEIGYCDLSMYAGIDSTNWSIYSSGQKIDSIQMRKFPAPFPENADYLHLNRRGQMKIAVAIAKWLGQNHYLD